MRDGRSWVGEITSSPKSSEERERKHTQSWGTSNTGTGVLGNLGKDNKTKIIKQRAIYQKRCDRVRRKMQTVLYI